jgi:hypothetical protein
MKSRLKSRLLLFLFVIACLLPSLALVTLPRRMAMDVRNGEDFWFYQVPSAATGIYARGSYADFSVEFSVSESDLRTHAQRNGWELEEITEPSRIKTYLAYDDTGTEDDYVAVGAGLRCDSWSRHGEGFSMLYDRELGKAYMEISIR